MKIMLTFLNYSHLLNIVTHSVTCLCFMFQSRSACKGRAIFDLRKKSIKHKSSCEWGKISRSLAHCGLAALLATCMVSCSITRKSTEQKRFKKRYQNFRYCELTTVKQSSQISCGVAALTSVLNYWKSEGQPEFNEKALVAQYPARSTEGYPILQLREMAGIPVPVR